MPRSGDERPRSRREPAVAPERGDAGPPVATPPDLAAINAALAEERDGTDATMLRVLPSGVAVRVSVGAPPDDADPVLARAWSGFLGI